MIQATLKIWLIFQISFKSLKPQTQTCINIEQGQLYVGEFLSKTQKRMRDVLRVATVPGLSANSTWPVSESLTLCPGRSTYPQYVNQTSINRDDTVQSDTYCFYF